MNDIAHPTKLTLLNFQIFKLHVKKGEYYFKTIETNFNKLLVMNKKDHEDFKNFIEYWIREKNT